MDGFITALAPHANTISWVGLALMIVVAVMTGQFIPRRTHDRMLQIQAETNALIVASLSKQLADSQAREEAQKQSAEAWETTATELLSQNGTMLGQSASTVHAVEEIRSALVVLAKDRTQ